MRKQLRTRRTAFVAVGLLLSVAGLINIWLGAVLLVPLIVGIWLYKADFIPVVIGVMLGLVIMAVNNYACLDVSKLLLEEKNVTGLECTIVDIEVRESGYFYTYGFISIDGVKILPTMKVKLFVREEQYGQLWSRVYIDAQLTEFNSTSAYDSEMYNRSNGIYLSGFLNKQEVIYMTNKSSIFNIDKLRNKLYRDYNSELAGFFNSIVLGDDEGIEEELMEAYRSTGIVHIFAISGLHIGLLALMVRMIFSNTLLERFRVTATMMAVGYIIVLTGFTISGVRAGIMIFIIIWGELLGRKSDAITALSIAMMVSVLHNPYVIMGLSFQLSFVATTALILFGFNVKNKLLSAMATSALVNVALLPIFAINFGYVTLYSVITNTITTPLLPLLLSQGYIALLPLPQVLINVNEVIAMVIVRYINTVTLYIADLPYATIGVTIPMGITLFLLFVTLYCTRKRLITSLCVVMVGIGVIVYMYTEQYNTEHILEVYSYNNSATIIIHQGEAIVKRQGTDEYLEGIIEQEILRYNAVELAIPTLG